MDGNWSFIGFQIIAVVLLIFGGAFALGAWLF